MPIRAKVIKQAILQPAKKMGVVIMRNSDADQAISSTARTAARFYNTGEKEITRATRRVKSEFEDLKAKVHQATAPRNKP